MLDSGIASALMDRREPVASRARAAIVAGHRIGICVPVLGELLSGIARCQNPAKNYQLLELALRGWTVWPYDTVAGREYGRIDSYLESIGRPMQTIDIQLAAIAISLGNCTVVTTDSDLAAVPELVVESWAA